MSDSDSNSNETDNELVCINKNDASKSFNLSKEIYKPGFCIASTAPIIYKVANKIGKGINNSVVEVALATIIEFFLILYHNVLNILLFQHILA